MIVEFVWWRKVKGRQGNLPAYAGRQALTDAIKGIGV